MRISYGALFILAPAIIGGIIWLTQLHLSVEANAAELSELENTVSEMDILLRRIDKTTAELKALMIYQLEKSN